MLIVCRIGKHSEYESKVNIDNCIKCALSQGNEQESFHENTKSTAAMKYMTQAFLILHIGICSTVVLAIQLLTRIRP